MEDGGENLEAECIVGLVPTVSAARCSGSALSVLCRVEGEEFLPDDAKESS